MELARPGSACRTCRPPARGRGRGQLPNVSVSSPILLQNGDNSSIDLTE